MTSNKDDFQVVGQGSTAELKRLHEEREGEAHPMEEAFSRPWDPGVVRELEEFVKETAKEREKKAKYKLEVTFGSKRTPSGQPDGNSAVICVYTSASRLHGGGDELALWCMRRDPGAGKMAQFVPKLLKVRRGETQGCGRVIPPDSVIQGTQVRNGKPHTTRVAVCPHCNRRWNVTELTEQIMGKWTTPRLAKRLADLWRATGHNADIVAKYHHTDIRYQAMEQSHGTAKARQLRGMLVYPLERILSDTAAGGSLETRLRAFLSA